MLLTFIFFFYRSGRYPRPVPVCGDSPGRVHIDDPDRGGRVELDAAAAEKALGMPGGDIFTAYFFPALIMFDAKISFLFKIHVCDVSAQKNPSPKVSLLVW